MPAAARLDIPDFFFTCYCAHRDLHSFPTRRSSDLAPVTILGNVRQPGRSARRDVPVRDFLSLDAYRARLDRKSTRLNSSHGYISYAVFCLKKKTKTSGRSNRYVAALQR